MNHEQLRVAKAAMDCFGQHQREHCAVVEIEGRWYWTIQMPGDYLSIGGMKLPLSTTITPCDKHLPDFERVFGTNEEEVSHAI